MNGWDRDKDLRTQVRLQRLEGEEMSFEEWNKIESAPKDGGMILVWIEGVGAISASWNEEKCGGWWEYLPWKEGFSYKNPHISMRLDLQGLDLLKPTHWRALLAP